MKQILDYFMIDGEVGGNQEEMAVENAVIR